MDSMLRHRNPLVDHETGGLGGGRQGGSGGGAAGGGTLAFELAWADVAGMDYAASLIKDGRLVLEASQLTKHVFASVGRLRSPAGPALRCSQCAASPLPSLEPPF